MIYPGDKVIHVVNYGKCVMKCTDRRPVKVMYIDRVWSMVIRSDVKGAMPYVCRTTELEKPEC